MSITTISMCIHNVQYFEIYISYLLSNSCLLGVASKTKKNFPRIFININYNTNNNIFVHYMKFYADFLFTISSLCIKNIKYFNFYTKFIYN